MAKFWAPSLIPRECPLESYLESSSGILDSLSFNQNFALSFLAGSLFPLFPFWIEFRGFVIMAYFYLPTSAYFYSSLLSSWEDFDEELTKDER